MTREEVIRILDPVTSMDALAEIEYYAGFRGQEAVRKAVDDACILAVAALREQEERENPKPLTLDELRKMDWEPVWCLCKPIDGGNGFWCICKKGTIIPPSCVRFDVKEIPHWVFLRNKPKEE